MVPYRAADETDVGAKRNVDSSVSLPDCPLPVRHLCPAEFVIGMQKSDVLEGDVTRAVDRQQFFHDRQGYLKLPLTEQICLTLSWP